MDSPSSNHQPASRAEADSTQRGERAEQLDAAPLDAETLIDAETIENAETIETATAISASTPLVIDEATAPPIVGCTGEIAGDERSQRRSWPRAIWNFVGSTCEWCFGLVCLLVGLAIVASVPVVQFVSLGYLLEASGRVASTGRLRDGLMGIRKAARVGGLLVGAWLVYLPLILVNEAWYSAYLIDPASSITANWRVAQLVVTAIVVLHVVVAWFSGGRLRDYLWPLAAPVSVPYRLLRGRGLAAALPPFRLLREAAAGDLIRRRRDQVWDFVAGLQLPQLFWLGLRGFAGAFAWLLIPIGLMVLAGFVQPGGAVLLNLMAAALLTPVLLYLPFLQVHFAREKRLSAMWEVGVVRTMFRRAPLAFWLALFVTLLFSVPLYLLKIELTPEQTLWIPSLVFVLFMFPARLLAGWAVGYASRREAPRHAVFRWAARLAQLPVALAYVGVVYVTQFLSWYGVWSLFEQHAFLTPAPFLGG